MQNTSLELELVASPQIPMEAAIDRLEHLIARINQVSTLPHTVIDVLRITNDPLADARDLSMVIEADPAIAARVMRCTNSAAHPLRKPIGDLRSAVNYLGFNQVRNLAVSASVCQLFTSREQIGAYCRRDLWDHMVAVALTSRLIARRLELPNAEEVYLAGLLHDLGIILEDQYCHARFSNMMRNFPAGRSLIQAERAYLGFDHTMLGFCVAERWGLPEAVAHTAAMHHAPTYDGPHAQTIACVELANVMCTTMGLRSCGASISQLSPAVLRHLNIERRHIHPIAIEMQRLLRTNDQLFRLVAAA